MTYLLFYSTYCKPSKEYLFYLQKSGIETYFMTVDIKMDPMTGKRPDIMYKYGITQTPSIVVEGGRVLQGHNAFKWLENEIDKFSDTIPSHASRDNKIAYNIGTVPNNIHQRQPNQHQQQQETGELRTMGGKINYASVNDQNANLITPRIDPNSSKRFKIPNKNLTGQTDQEKFQETFGNMNPNTGQMMDTSLQKTNTQRDSLKLKQGQNEYARMMEERDMDTPQPNQAFQQNYSYR